jgi:hypothetical protein
MRKFVGAGALAVALFLGASHPASAQGAAKKIPAGMYRLVADPGYSVEFDASTVELQFTDSTLTATQNGTMLAKSLLKYSGDEVAMTDIDGQLMCGPARYRVQVKSGEIRLVPIEDPCDQRSAVLSQVKLVKH